MLHDCSEICPSLYVYYKETLFSPGTDIQSIRKADSYVKLKFL